MKPDPAVSYWMVNWDADCASIEHSSSAFASFTVQVVSSRAFWGSMGAAIVTFSSSVPLSS